MGVAARTSKNRACGVPGPCAPGFGARSRRQRGHLGCKPRRRRPRFGNHARVHDHTGTPAQRHRHDAAHGGVVYRSTVGGGTLGTRGAYRQRHRQRAQLSADDVHVVPAICAVARTAESGGSRRRKVARRVLGPDRGSRHLRHRGHSAGSHRGPLRGPRRVRPSFQHHEIRLR
jgi:hypothetical protein